MDEKIVDAEVVESVRNKTRPKPSRRKINSSKMIARMKLGVAVFLDLADLILGWIPLINTAWDIVTFAVLLVILKNKRLAFLSLIELPFLGIPPFSIIDAFLPIATALTIMDINIEMLKKDGRFFAGTF